MVPFFRQVSTTILDNLKAIQSKLDSERQEARDREVRYQQAIKDLSRQLERQKEESEILSDRLGSVEEELDQSKKQLSAYVAGKSKKKTVSLHTNHLESALSADVAKSSDEEDFHEKKKLRKTKIKKSAILSFTHRREGTATARLNCTTLHLVQTSYATHRSDRHYTNNHCA